MFRLSVDQASVKLKTIETLTKGRIGIKVQIFFNQDWYDLDKIVNYEYRVSGETIVGVEDESFDGTISTIPSEVLANDGGELYIAIKGMSNGSVVIPTIYAFMGVVKQSFVPEFFPTPHVSEWRGGIF